MSAMNTSPPSTTNNSMADTDDDNNLFQAARRNGRRNAFGDLGEQILQGKKKENKNLVSITNRFALVNAAIRTAEIEQMMPNFQSMTLKQ